MSTPLPINTNVASISAQKHLGRSSRALQTSIGRLSSGVRLTSAADAAAGMAVSTSLTAQLGGYQVAQRNANDGIAILNTAEGGLASIADTLIRLRELAVQAANDGLTDTERAYVNTEFFDLLKDTRRIANVTEYNGIKVLDGSAGDSGVVVFQVGTRNSTNDRITVDLSKPDTSVLSGLGVTSLSTAQQAITSIDSGIAILADHRAMLGSKINTLTQAVTNLGATVENVNAAVSHIRDVDVAAESAAFSTAFVLQRAGTAMLVQANQTPKLALRLLG